jgi:hypothetical protein
VTQHLQSRVGSPAHALPTTTVVSTPTASTKLQQSPSARRRRAVRISAVVAVLACSGAALLAAETPAAANPITTPAYHATVNVHDTMHRTVHHGLGKAGVGGTWSTAPASKFSVSNGAGHISAIAKGHSVHALLPASHTDEQLQVAFVLPKLPVSGVGIYTALEFRRHPSSAVYRVRVLVGKGGKMTLGVSRLRNHKLVHIGGTVVLSKHASAGKTIMLSGLVAGSKTVRIRARAWVAGSTRPGWQLGTSDTSASRITTGGRVGLYISSDTNGTSSRVALKSFHGSSLKAVSSPPPTPAPSSGKPGPSNTGVPAGTKLKRHDGNMIITKAGATYDALDIHGFVTIKAPNVTIKRSIIRGGVESKTNVGVVTNVSSNGTNFLLQDSEIVPAHPSVYIDGIKGWNYTLNRVDIHGTVDTAKVFGNNATIKNSWLHGTVYYAHDPYQGGGHTHNDGVQVLSGTNIHIVHNTITGAYNAAMQVTQGHGTVDKLWFTTNWADGGGCSVNLNNSPKPTMKAITVSTNRFGHNTRNANCPIIATHATQLTANGNVWDDTGKPAAVRNGD